MKKISLILSALLVLSSLVGCTAAKNGKDNDTTTAAETKPSVNNTGIAYKDGILMEIYLYTLSNYFFEPYNADNGSPKADVIHATAEFLYTQRPHKVTADENKEGTFSVKGETLLEEARLLFGDGVSLQEYSQYLSDAFSDSYDSETDVYTFCYDYEKWNSGNFIPSADKLESIEESAEGFVGLIYGTDKDGKSVSVRYTFSKQISDEYLYATLKSVEVEAE